MEQTTINLLKTYDNNIIKLDISNMNICGILDLYDFHLLTELYCSNNKITCIKIPSKLKYLDCSNNLITELYSLPRSLIELYYFDNPITYIRFNYTISSNRIFPNTLIDLTLEDKFNEIIDFLPPSLERLTFGYHFNQPVNNLPNNLKY